MKTSETIFFLFGGSACQVLIHGGTAEQILNDGILYSVCRCCENTKPSELLAEFNGWDDYAEITKEQYNILK